MVEPVYGTLQRLCADRVLRIPPYQDNKSRRTNRDEPRGFTTGATVTRA